jgi:fermentation-respiration switch protein FrsA (DUF1100 family)
VTVPHYGFAGEQPLDFGFYADGQRYREPVPPAAPALIVHGSKDAVVPVRGSRRYEASHRDKVDLVEVDAGHDLNDHLDLIWDYVQSFLLGR